MSTHFRIPNHRCVVAAFALMIAISPQTLCRLIAQEQVDTAKVTKDDVLDLLEQLNASSLTKRREAEKALIEAGPDALDYLPETAKGMSIEASERLTRVRSALQNLKAQSEAKEDVVRVRLNTVTNLGEALEAISRDSGVEFEYDGDESVAVRSVESPLPFWHAVDLVLDAANLDINFYGGDASTLLLVPRHAERPSRVDSAAYTGVYRIEPTTVTSRRSLNQPDMSALNISIEISWEPRLTPIGLSIPVNQLSGRLDDAAALKPQDSGDTIDVATNADLAFSEFFLPMQLPAGQPSRITSLSGVIRALLPGRKQTFKLPLAELGKEHKIDSMTVRIEDVRENGAIYEVRVGVELENADRSLESHRHWIFENAVHINRKDGSRADHLGYEVYRQTNSGVGIGYLFDLGDTALESTLIYHSPTSVVKNEVPFVIQDIPLP
ncbi:hypothetical protein Pla22_44010 [Rubripirellula amarantea]|uniref:Uncharacterized protein n=1 Tax=Rubripirellula amarantea TaxID=2527999 RepID=A0A5C5WGH3_9BACT|nr:hypothetical protein [Rubripirellula amarantea]TWT49209.1 hypothetical protein Pla22_44010 [Rubripirellula amarantea]